MLRLVKELSFRLIMEIWLTEMSSLHYVFQVNRDPMAAEMQRMRHQLELMQAELICARGGGPSSADVQVRSLR